MVTRVKIERFKSLKSVTLNLEKINVLVGANNAGKSSVLQALQFITSVAQTAKLFSQSSKLWKEEIWATSVYPDQLIYSPVKDPYSLARGGMLKEDVDQAIRVSFTENFEHDVAATVRKGKNKNIAVRFEGADVGKKLSSLENPFCMYVPGLAGIPFEEEIRTVAVVRKMAAKGDSNTVFRNVINLLFTDKTKWQRFLADLQEIFPGIEFAIHASPELDGFIDVRFKLSSDDPMLPIDLAGTGILQAIQIAAYVNYFKPSLLLLDEPDSHLHPDNQRILAALLISLSDRTDTTIIISTHSRHLMAALRNDAKFFLVKKGEISDAEYNHYIGLLELGALDEYDIIRNGDLKYVVLTEDSSNASRKYLRCILEASGYNNNEFQIYSYNSVTKIDSAKMFAQFLLDLNPNLTIIIYRDRDGLYDEEIEKVKKNLEFDSRVKCVIAHFNDIEMYYCSSSHIVEICEMSGFELKQDEAESLITDAIQTTGEESKNKFYAHRVAMVRGNQGDPGKAMTEAEKKYSANPIIFAYGKKVAGVLTSKLQGRFKTNIDIYQKTEKLAETQFVSIREGA